MNRLSWTKILLGMLLLTGFYELFQGLVGGPLNIYAQESRLAGALGLHDLHSERAGAFWRFIAWSKNQWLTVAWAGFVNVTIAISLMCLLRKDPKRSE